MQRRYNKSIKDPDALYKQLAFAAVTEQKYKKKVEEGDNMDHLDKEYQYSPFTFERYYINQLEQDAQKEPRPVNPDDYKPKKFIRAEKAEEPRFLYRKEREEKYFEDHKLFLENKKEQIDRTKIFFILEQFYEHSREQPSQLSEAQEHMREYFSDPDNTYFFDKTKMQ